MTSGLPVMLQILISGRLIPGKQIPASVETKPLHDEAGL